MINQINTKIILIILLGLGTVYLVSCDLAYTPADQLTTESIEERPELLENLTAGNYSRLKGEARTIHENFEFSSDASMMGRSTSDPLLYTYNYEQTVESGDSRDLWLLYYHSLHQINEVIERIPDNASAERLNLKGENLFLRAFMHFHLVRLFSRPYSHGRDNLGVIIKNSTDMPENPARSTVGETYDFIVNDFTRAAELMSMDKGNTYASEVAAWGFLARVYLYMEENELALEYANRVINSGRHELIPTQDLADYFRFTPEQNPETIFATKFLPSENQGRGAMASMHHGDGGWGQVFASKKYRDLLFQNGTDDERIYFIDPAWVLDEDGNRIPDPTEDIFPGDDQGYLMEKRSGESKWWTLKQTYEQGIAMLHSPCWMRLAEMYLTRAEANAKLGRDQQAIDDVNRIRQRAGLSGAQLYSVGDLKGHDTVLDVVLEERFLELAFERLRADDVFRNKRDMDRWYILPVAWTGDKLIPWDSNKIYHLIPQSEITLNPNLQQNPLP